NSAAYDGAIINSGGDIGIYTQTDGSNARLTVKNSGNVGIGTTGPVSPLNVKGSTGYGSIKISPANDNGEASMGFMRDIAGTDTNDAWVIGSASWGHAGDFVIGNENNGAGGNVRLLIEKSGNVGINTTTPTQKLHVAGGAQLDLVSYGVTPGDSQTLALSTVEYVKSKVGGAGGVGAGTSGQTLRHNGTSWIANSLFYNNGTNIGIGTTGPGNKLDLSGDFGLNGILKGYGAASNNFLEGKLGINTLSAGASSLAVFGNASIGSAYLSNAAPANGLIIQGNVGIGTTDPTESLHVAGNLKVDGGISLAGNLVMASSTLTVNKITANTIDPLYTINGIKYSTYASSIVGGVNEEYVGRINANEFKKVGSEYEKIINFTKTQEGSDLWVWRKVIAFNEDNVEIFLTPRGSSANMYAYIEDEKIIIRSNKAVSASIRLVGRRFDFIEWPTRAFDQNQVGGLVVE
ncbi:MAG: hypothetical protein WCT50_05100, partial [Patescibacteria group bacterium]